MRDFTRALGGLGAKPRNQTVVLARLPGISDVEELMGERGVLWSAAFEDKCDAVSLSLFGVKRSDTEPAEPHPDRIKDPNGSAFRFSNQAFDAYNRALAAWYHWQEVMAGMEAEIDELGAVRFWARNAFDVTDGYGDELRCLPLFSRQMYAAVKELLPSAKLTLNGSGGRAAQSTDDWGAALAAEAARWRSSR